MRYKIKYNTGVYQLRDLINNKRYIGKALNLSSRKSYHWCMLKKNKHDNIFLQEDYNKYKKNNFSFEHIIYCEPFELERYEQGIIDYTDKNLLYNIFRKCVRSPLGIIRREMTKEKISKNHADFSGDKHAEFGKVGEDSRNFGKKYKGSTSAFYGVSLRRENNSWVACIIVDKKTKHIGIFDNEIMAAKAYNKYVIDHNLPNPLNNIQGQ
jgi:group I intron endonuclease